MWRLTIPMRSPSSPTWWPTTTTSPRWRLRPCRASVSERWSAAPSTTTSWSRSTTRWPLTFCAGSVRPSRSWTTGSFPTRCREFSSSSWLSTPTGLWRSLPSKFTFHLHLTLPLQVLIATSQLPFLLERKS